MMDDIVHSRKRLSHLVECSKRTESLVSAIPRGDLMVLKVRCPCIAVVCIYLFCSRTQATDVGRSSEERQDFTLALGASSSDPEPITLRITS